MANKRKWCLLLPMGLCCLLAALIYFGFPVCRFTAEVLLLIAGILLGFFLLLLLKEKRKKAGKILLRIYTACVVIGVLIAAVTGIAILRASRGDPDAECDYIVVLGAGVRGDVPSLSLQDRIRAAHDYLTAHPHVICIVSGGQGPGENLSEAACMYRELTKMGISDQRIWLEDQSTSTLENLTFSMQVLEDHGVADPGTIGILSSEYHLLRAGFFADKLGIEHAGIPAKTGVFALWVNYFLREIVAVWYHILMGGSR